MKLRKQLAAAFASAVFVAGAVQAAQVVNFANVTKNLVATTSPIFVVPGDVIRFDTQLQQNGPGLTSGLGLCLSYNNTVTGTLGISSLYLSQLVANGAAQQFVLPTVCDDGGGTPAADATTMIIKGWADAQGQGGFPVNLATPGCTDEPPTATCEPVPLPLLLYRGTFTVQAGFTGSSQLAFSASSPAQSAGMVNEPFSSPSSPLIVCAAPTVAVGTPVDGSETGPTAASMTVSLSAAVPAECGTGGVFPVTLTLGGSATATTDYAASGTGVSNVGNTVTINFPADGSTSSTVVTLTPVDDSSIEVIETVTLAVAAGSGNYLGVGANSSVNITDNDVAQPTITIVATTPSAAEPSTNGLFTVTRTAGNAAQNMLEYTVNLTITGTASNGTDYTTIPTTVTIPAMQTSVTIPVTVTDDIAAESTETVIVTIQPGASYTVGSPAAATVNIADDDGPITVTIAATTPNAAEPSTNGLFTVTRTAGNAAQNMLAYTVNLTITGTASNGTDYTTIPTTVTIPAMQTSVTIPVTVTDDAAPESTETVIVTIQPGASYTVGAPAAATVNIADDDGPVTVTIAATTPNAAEPSTNGLFTVTRTAGNAAQNMLAYTVNLSITGTASNGTDYTTIPTTVTIPAMQTSVTIPVTVTDDVAPESTETVIVTIQPGASYTVGAPAAATVNIADDDGPITVTIAATTPNAAEPSTNGLFTVTRTAGNAGQNMLAYTVNLTITGTATNGTDYTTIPTTVTIPAMQTSVTIPVTVTDDPTLEGNETVIVTVATGANYVVGAPAVATVTIADDEIGISVSGVAPPVEGGSFGIFGICRTGSTVGALLVTFNVGGSAVEGVDYTLSGNTMNTITIPDGQECVNLIVNAINNLNIDAARDITITLVAGGGTQVVPGQGTAQLVFVDDERPLVIPTMSTLGMLLMGLLLAGIAGFSIRRRA